MRNLHFNFSFSEKKKKSKLTPKTTCSNQFFWEFMILCRKLALYACVCNIRTFSLRVFGCTGRLYVHNRYGRKIFLKKKSSRFFRRFCAVVYARESRWSVGRVWPREPKTNWLIDRAAAAVADTATAGDRQLFSAEILWIWSKSTTGQCEKKRDRPQVIPPFSMCARLAKTNEKTFSVHMRTPHYNTPYLCRRYIDRT